MYRRSNGQGGVFSFQELVEEVKEEDMKCVIILLLAFVSGGLSQGRSTVKPKDCQPTEFDCGSKCIPQRFVCDGHFDCPTGIDENGCKEIVRAATEEIPLDRDVPVFGIEVGKPKDISQDKPTEAIKPTTTANESPRRPSS